MPDIRILLVIGVAVIGFPLFVVLFFGHLFYRREVRIKTLSSKSVEGVVVGYKRAQIVAAPIVEYRVDGQTYRNSLKYYRLVRATLPWKTNQVASDIDLMAQRITIYTNSTVSKGNLFQDAFTLGSTMTVWYNPACPKESYVERYSGLDKSYKRQNVDWNLDVNFISYFGSCGHCHGDEV